MVVRRILGIGSLWLLLATCAFAAKPLTICVEEAPQRPWTMPDVSGLAIDLLGLVQQQLGEEFGYVVRPWRRCLEELKLGAVDAVVGGAATPERQRYARFPLRADGEPDSAQAMYTDRFDVYLRAGSGAAWDGRTLTLGARPTVLTQRGYAVVEQLRQQGYTVADIATTASDALRHLAAGVHDVAIVQASEAGYVYRKNSQLHSAVARAGTPYFEAPMYLMVSTAAYERDAGRIDALWREIANSRQTRAFRQLERTARANH